MFIDAFATKYILSIACLKLLFLLSLHLWQISECLFIHFIKEAWRGEGTCPWTQSMWEAEAECQCPGIFPIHQSRLSLPSQMSWYFCISSLRGCGRPVPAAEPVWNPHPRHTQGAHEGVAGWCKASFCEPTAPPSPQPPGVLSEPWQLFLGELHSLKNLFFSEKEMAIHSTILAWEIPWTEDPGGL